MRARIPGARFYQEKGSDPEGLTLFLHVRLGYDSESSGESISGTSSASPDSCDVGASAPGMPQKSMPTSPLPLAPSEPISSGAASRCSSVAVRVYADTGPLSDVPLPIVLYRFSPFAAG